MPCNTDMLNLNKLVAFQHLREILENNSANKHVRNLLAYKDKLLYLWNPEECCLYMILLTTAHEEKPLYQKFYPSSPPVFEVDEILINEPGTLCALVGSKGVSVMRFPNRLSKSVYDSVNSKSETVTCSTSHLQDKFFISKHLTDVKRVRWYPGSPEDNHVVVLTNDKNCLRLFKVDSQNGKLMSIWRLGPETSRMLASLGDTAVDFDFLPPVLIGERTESDPSITWPILVLQGNGEVLCLNTTVDDTMNIKSAKISGPLTMYPPADDNYSEDACSLLVLDTVPPSVVIASNFGELYNCLLLPETINKTDTYQPYKNQLEYSLHIIETVELELGLNVTDNNEYENLNTMQLKKDCFVSSKYWCLHNTGIHSVSIPLTELLDEFSKSSDNDKCLELANVQGQSVIEYYICTGLMNGDTKPIKGFAILDFPTDLLVTMLSNGEVVTQAIPDYSYNKLSISNKYINEDDHTEIDQVDDSDKSNTIDFSSFISELLHKNNSNKNTILKLGSDIPNNILIQMVLQTISTRQETLKNHKIVAEEIERRIQVLFKVKQRLLSEMQVLEKARQKLQADVESKAEKLDEINNKQEEFTKRASAVLLRLVTASPESITTKKKRELLNLYKSKIDLMNKRIEETREKWNIVQTESTSKNKQFYGQRSFRLNFEQELVIKGNLSEMGSTILDLEKKVRDLRSIVNSIAS